MFHQNWLDPKETEKNLFQKVSFIIETSKNNHINLSSDSETIKEKSANKKHQNKKNKHREVNVPHTSILSTVELSPWHFQTMNIECEEYMCCVCLYFL